MLTLSYQYVESTQADALHLVLIHGWGLHSGVWEKVIEPLRAFAHLTIIDRAGYGASPMMSPDEEQQALLAIVPPVAIYVGWSLGTMKVLALASLYPERVLAVIAVAATPCFVQRDDWPYAMPIAVFKDFEQRVLENPDLGLMRFIGLQCQGSASQRQDMHFLQAQLAQQPIPQPCVLEQGLRELAQLDNRSIVQKLRCPLLWMQGANDGLAHVNADVLMRLNPLMAVQVISQAGHVPFVSHPQIFSDVIKRFIHELQHDEF